MTDEDGDRAHAEIRNVEREMVARLMGMSDDELAAELLEDGFDPGKDDGRVEAVLERAAGRARMAAAREAVAANRSRSAGRQVAGSPASLVDAKGLTMAARNGKEQSADDIASAARDLADLDAFDDGNPGV